MLFSVARSLMWFNKILSNCVTWNEVVICNRQAVSCRNVIAGPTARYRPEMLVRLCLQGHSCTVATGGSWHESPVYSVIHLFRNFLCLCFLLPLFFISVLIVLLSFFSFIPILFIFSWDSSVGTVANIGTGCQCIHESILGRGNRLVL